jgi:hypothetical protein
MKIYQAVQKLLLGNDRQPFWMIEKTFNAIITIQNFIQIHETVQKFQHLRSLNVRHFGVIDIIFTVITSVQNFMQKHQLIQKLHPPQKFKRLQFLMV